MTRIAALNDWSIGSSEEEDVGPTREALEAQATKSYNEAIRHLAHHNLDKAYEHFCLVLQNPYVEKACWPEGVKKVGALPQDVALRYSCLKNLGNLETKEGDYEQAAKHYLEAVQLDKTEVTVWQRLGATAIKLKDFELALIAFQEGLNVNCKHWPCLDQLLSVLFILEMYMDCLGLIIMALKRDPNYTKANAFKDKIFEIQPSLLEDVKHFYRDCDILFHSVSYDRAQGDKFIKTCETLRPPCKTPRPVSPFQLQQLRKPLPKLTWDDLAHALIQTYDVLSEADGLVFAARIDVHEALKIKEDEECADAGKNLDTNGVNNTNAEGNHQESKNANVEGNEKMEIDSTNQENKASSKASVDVDTSKQEKSEPNIENENKCNGNKSPNSEERINASNMELSDNSQTPKRIPSRRQTIELGESQDSFRVSEKRRSVDSDTFSHPEDDLKDEDEGGNQAGEVAPSNASSKFCAGTFVDEKNEKNDDKNIKDSEKIASEAKDSVKSDTLEVSEQAFKTVDSQKEANLSKEDNDAGNVDKTASKRKIIEVDSCTTEENPETKRHKLTEPIDKDTACFSKLTSKDNTQERVSDILDSDNMQDNNCKGTQGVVDTCKGKSGGKDVCQSLNNTGKAEEQNNPVEESSHKAAQKEAVSCEAANIVVSRSDISEERKDKSSPQDYVNRNGEGSSERKDYTDENVLKEKDNTGAPLNIGAETEANVSREISDQEENLVNDTEEDKQDDDADEMEEAEEEQEIGEDGELRENEEEEEGLEEEEEVDEGEEGEEGLLSSETTETEAAVNTLKGIMALQPTEILGLPEPDFDYDSEYVEYFDGGVYEDEDDDIYQDEPEMGEEGIVQGMVIEGIEPVIIEAGMEQVVGMEQVEGMGQIDATEQAEELEQVEEMEQECGTEQVNEGDEEEEVREDIVEQEQEGDMDKREGEQDEGNRVCETEHEEPPGKERLEKEGKESYERGRDRGEAGQGDGLEQDGDPEQERMVESHEVEPEEVVRQGVEQQEGDSNRGDIMEGDIDDQDNGERDGVDEAEYREDELDVESQEDLGAKDIEKESQNEEEGEDRSLGEKRNSTEDDTVQPETDTEAEGSKTAKTDKDEKNKKGDEDGDITSHKTQGDGNTSAEVSNKSEEAKAVTRVVRKPKRHKRGLERELEQLDYWGRRQERDAKRRRRTISSKLLGTIEEAEYLTWGDLLRSFVPTSLLNCSAEDKNKNKPLQQELPTGKGDEKGSGSFPINNSPIEIDATSSTTPKQNMSSPTGKGGVEPKSREGEAVTLHKSAADHLSHADKSSLGLNGEIPSSKDNVALVKPEEGMMDVEQNAGKDTEKIKEKCNTDKNKEKCDLKKSKDETATIDKEVNDTEKAKENIEDSIANIKKKRDELILSSVATEQEQVEAFLLRHEENGGILDLLQPFLTILWKRHGKVWPTSAAKIFTEIYPRVRNHVLHGEALSLQEDSTKLYQDSMLALTHWELMISLYFTAKHSVLPSQHRSIDKPFSRECPHLEDDLVQLSLMLGRGDVWVTETPKLHTRVRWLQSQVRLGQDQPEQAVSFLHLLLCDLERLSEPGTEFVVERVHVETDQTVVSNSEVRRNLNFLQRSHMLEQVVDNYTDGRYQVVAELLTTIFHEPQPKSRPGVTLPTRQTQLAILIDSLYKLKDYKGVVSWGAQGLEEALMRYNRAEADEEKNRWAKSLMKISDTLNSTLEHHITSVEEVNRERLSQLVTTLIAMLVIQLEKSPNAQVLPFETLSPWVLLHRMLAHEEKLQIRAEREMQQDLERKKATKNESDSDKVPEEQNASQNLENDGVSVTTGISYANYKKIEDKVVGQKEENLAESKGPLQPHPSTLFLITAHDELGKHSWCSFDDGVLLLYCLDVLVAEVQRGLDQQYHQLLVHTLEQVSFCLYSHPSKKSKHKHLRDHGVTQITLCWERAMQLYRFYCPPQLPDFQSSQIPSITDDVASLHKRIIALFPAEVLPESHVMSVEAYIKGEEEECKYPPINPPTEVIRDCYYLLGDFYFKNKEWMNAIKHYKLDLTINPDRLESWAPLGLTMKAILETQLNSCEVIQDEVEFFSMAQAAVRCLRQALKLDEYHTNLWVEFGGLVYMVHSHASRLLKQDLNPDISLDTFEMLEKLKGEMLTQAELCFTKARRIQEEGWDDESLPDERWLHCYMLGKVAEKQSNLPETILQYYLNASEHLHQIQAKYPIKINYNSPQEYSVEALEMYYRAHAFILKYLQQREGKSVEQEIIKTFTRILDKFAEGPFACCQERKSFVDSNAASAIDKQDISDSKICVDNYLSQKKQREEYENEAEPTAKKIQMDGQLYDIKDAIKDVVIEMIDNAVTLATEKNDKEVNEIQVDDCNVDTNVGSCKDTTLEKDKKDSDDEIQVVEEKVIEKNIHIGMLGRCIGALKLCLSRFPQHYKALYRLAHYYNSSKFCKDCSRARNYLLGCDFWQRVGYMPVNGLFNERKVWIQQPRNCNFFHGVWRIPNDEVDRPGSFAAHMYRCVSLTLDVLPQMKDFYSVLQIALALKNSPEKDKKYLRDNERELLSEHATQVGLQIMKDKYKILFKESSPIHGSRRMTFLLDVFRSYKQISKHLPGSEPHLAKMLTDSYASYRGLKQDNRANILREADAFCTRNQHLQHRVTTVAPTAGGQPGQAGQLGQLGTISGVTSMARRGRPPGTGRGRGRGRGALFPSRNVSNLKVVQEAYKLYENLFRLQSLLSSKTLDQAATHTHQKELEYCQAELLKYLRYPSVSQYFHASLQGMGAPNTNKLPPPPKLPLSSSGTSPGTQAQVALPSKDAQGGQQSGSSQQRPTLSALAARSQAHGISITSVPSTKASNPGASKPIKPSMSVTVSPVKTCPSVLQGRGEISVISMSRPAATSKVTPATTTTLSRPTGPKISTPSTTTAPKPTLTTKPSASSPKPVSSQPGSSSTPNSPSVPKLPAGTTLTRPRDPPSTPSKGSCPRPQLQAQARPAKSQNADSALDGLSSPMRKVATDMISSTSPAASRPGSSGSGAKVTPSGQTSKPSIPKGMTITPAPRIKSKALMSPSRTSVTSASSPSSYLGAYKASLGLGGTKTAAGAGRGAGGSHSVSASVIAGEGRGMTSPATNKQVTQLSTSQLMQLAYGRGTSSGNISGLLNQISKKQPAAGGQVRPQARLPGPVPQRFPAPALARPQTNPGHRVTQLRPGMQVRPSQVRQFSPGKSLQNKPAPSKSGSSDDIITLD